MRPIGQPTTIDHPLALIGGAVLFVVGLIPAVPRIFLENNTYSNGEAFVVASMLMAGGCLLIRFGGARRLAGGVAIAIGAAAVLKPWIAPISYGYGDEVPHPLAWDSESHLFYVLPGLAMVAFGVALALIKRTARAPHPWGPRISALPAARAQHFRFAHIFLRDVALRATPHAAAELTGPSAPAYLGRLWADAGAAVDLTGKVFPGGLGVSMVAPVGHGWTAIVVRMPPPDRPSEAYAAALAYRQDSAHARYFVLEHGVPQVGQPPPPTLAEWRIDGTRTRHADVPGADDGSFLAAVAHALEVTRF